jgi:hypothetical protein
VTTGRYARENFSRAGYDRELAAFREVLREPEVSAPVTAVDLAELERLVARYPDHARQFVDRLNPPNPGHPPPARDPCAVL